MVSYDVLFLVFMLLFCAFCVFLFKQKTAYEMRISDWSSDVCSSDLQRQQGGRDRGHARREGERILRFFPKAEPVLQYFLIGAIEARIDQPFRRTLPLAGNLFEKAFARRRAFEHEGGGQEDRRLQRAFGQGRKIGRAHGCTLVTNAPTVCRLLLEKKK